jgi:small conductance mechanosensitive channel
MTLNNWLPIIIDKLEKWEKKLVEMLPNFVLAAIVLTLFFFVSRLIRNIIYKIVFKISKSESLTGLVAGVLQAAFLVVGLMMALNVLNLEKTVSSLLAGVGIIGLALGFAFQDLTANFISGVFMAIKRPFEVGDKVETNGYIGTVYHIELRSTTIMTTAGLHVVIPNKDIFQKPIINYSRSDERRVELDLFVPNTFDLSVIESVVRDSLKNINTSKPISDIEIFYTGIDDVKIKFTVSFHIDNAEPKGFLDSRHKAIKAIYKALGDKGIVKIVPLDNNVPADKK